MAEPPPAPKVERHPIAMVFHWLFKSAAVAWFILCDWFVSSFVINFVVSIILISLDFWTASACMHGDCS